MGSSLLLQLALLFLVLSFVVQSDMKNGNITIKPAISPSESISIASTSTSTWDSFAKGILKNLSRLLVELEINAFWYKDFIVFDYFEFVF